jgi:hypothetical protein
MDEIRPEIHGPEHHSYKPKLVILVLIGLVGGAALYFGVMAWYFTRIDPGGGPPGLEGDATTSSSDDVGNGNLALDMNDLEVVPLSEAQVKSVSGSAESVETPKDSGLTASLEGNSVKILAAKGAKAGPHQVTIRDATGKQATLNVSVKPTQ